VGFGECLRVLSYFLFLIVLAIFPRCANAKFYYPNFLDVTSLKLRGSAKKRGQCLLLTDFTSDEIGAVWYKKEVNIDQGFFTAFNIRIKPPPRSWQDRQRREKGFLGAGEGMAFVMHRSPSKYRAIGEGGSGLGYSQLQDAIAVEFDTKKNPENKDPNSNHISLHLPHHSSSQKANAFEYDLRLSRTDVPPLASGEIYTVQISYDGSVLKIFLNDLVNPILQTEASISGSYWLGFTATTGSKTDEASQHRVCDWYFETSEEDSKCDSGFVGPGCALDVAPSLSECLGQNTCSKCLNHIRDCRWCSSQKRCVAGAVSSDSVSTLKKSFCEDPNSLISDDRECRFIGHDFMTIWNSFMSLLFVLLVFAVFGRMLTSPERSSSSQFKRSCFRNSVNMHNLFILLESTCAGAIFAVLISFCVNYSLFLLTTYTLYSLGLGLLFILIGSLILWQTLSEYFEHSKENSVSMSHCLLLCCSALYLTACGVICFMLESNFARNMSKGIRVAVYGAVGISLCFSIVFITVDLCTRLANMCRRHQAKPLAQHVMYTRLLTISACISGLYFGYTFGMMELDDADKSYVELALQEQNYYCYPLGCILGGLSAFINRFMSMPVFDSKMIRRMSLDGL